MPEHGRQERLPEQVTEGSSSDAFIKETIRGLQQQISGTTGQVVEVGGQDVLEPKLAVSTGRSEVLQSLSKVASLGGKSPTNSVTGLALRERREGLRKA